MATEMITRLTAEPLAPPSPSALEDPCFPFEQLSEIAELESWRKEVNRPIYHLHKWWAQRLGSVFRSLLIGALTDDASLLLERFYQPMQFSQAVVFDPFMGSGTTIGEALKLGIRAIGRDINHVAYFAVKNAFSTLSRAQVMATFQSLERDVASTIRSYYLTRTPNGEEADVLYYFWVKVVSCPSCTQQVDLFSSYIFARHAYPKRNPAAKAVCPACGAINTARYDADNVCCASCGQSFNTKEGPARGTKAVCPNCMNVFPIAYAVRQRDKPPDHRMYAKLALTAAGTKVYLPTNEEDELAYRRAADILSKRKDAFPVVPIEPGYNTNQVLNYQYRYWHEMFNQRQLLALSLLAERIRAIEDQTLRDLFTCLFSGVLEFNNMFASYKGEGTGAVRHMFSHHILKPERTPLEANPWGTPKSSGSFSTLFRSRLLRALEYRDKPFEIRPAVGQRREPSRKVYGLSAALGQPMAASFAEFVCGENLYLSCGDSTRTDLATESVSLVVTDPPFFDNVHYSELADFFHVWQRHILGDEAAICVPTTRSTAEVQSTNPSVFADRLGGVFSECHRVLRSDGLLVFTYHHSRSEGWEALLTAIGKGGFVVTAALPIKAELSRATPKQQACEPIDLDVILVCRKRQYELPGERVTHGGIVAEAARTAAIQIKRFNARGRRLSRNDVRVALMAQLITRLSQQSSLNEALAHFKSSQGAVEPIIDEIHASQSRLEPIIDEIRAVQIPLDLPS